MSVAVDIVGRDALSPAAASAARSLDQLGSAGSKAGGLLSSVFGGLGAGVGFAAGLAGIHGISSAISGIGDAAIGMNSKLEQAKIGFTSMLGSGEKAESFLKELQQFANTTPFEFPQLLQASQRMLAFGFSSEQVKPLLTAVGSAASAMGQTGSEGISRITLALGQMRAATVVQAGELNQLTEAGIPSFQILADKLGITTGEVKKLVEQGKIASDVFIDAFQEWANANFGDMMEKQSHTFAGAMSTIHDTLISVGARAFRPFFELLSQFADRFAQFTQTETFNAWADAVASGMQRAFDAVQGFAAALAPLVTEGLRQLGDAWRTVGQVFQNDWSPSAVIDPFVNAVGLAASVVRDQLVPAVTSAVGFLADHTEIVVGFGAALLALVGVSVVVGVLTAVAGAVALLLSPIGLLVTAVGLLTAAWVGNWGDIQGKTAAVIEFLTPLIEAFASSSLASFTTVGDAITMTVARATASSLTEIAAWAASALETLSAWGAAAVETLTGAWAAISGAFEAGNAATATLWQAGWDALGGIQTAAWGVLSAENQARIAELETLTSELWVVLGELWAAGTSAVASTVTTWWAALVAEATAQMAAITTTTQTGLTTIGEVWTSTTAAISGVVTTWWGALVAEATTMMAAITAAIQSALAPWVGLFEAALQAIGGAISSAAGDLASAARSLGSAIIESVISAVNARVGAIADILTAGVRRAIAAARAALPAGGGEEDVEGRASGGPVFAGLPYVVGERRPELFVPASNGYILPRVPARSAATATRGMLSGPSVTNNFYGLTQDEAFAEATRRQRRAALIERPYI